MSFITKFLDFGGFIASKTVPKAFAPVSGPYGTLQALKGEDDASARPPGATAAAASAAPVSLLPAEADTSDADARDKARKRSLLSSDDGGSLM